MKLSEEQQLRPEVIRSKESLLSYAGPMLARLTNDSWLLLPNSIQLQSSANVTILDPSAGNKFINVPCTQFEERFSGTGVIFHNLAQIDTAKQSRLFAFVSIAKHHDTPVDIREIMHEYAVGEDEVSDSLFARFLPITSSRCRKSA